MCTTIHKMMTILLFLVVSEGVASAQPARAESSCSLSTFKNGQTVTVHGKIGQAPHDMALVMSGCSDAVVLVYAGDLESRESSDKLLKDKNLEQFEKYTSATYRKIGGKGICMQCPKYEVEATLTGRLDVAADTVPEDLWKDKLGMLHDQSGKFVGDRTGPTPFPEERVHQSLAFIFLRQGTPAAIAHLIQFVLVPPKCRSHGFFQLVLIEVAGVASEVWHGNFVCCGM
jgi:hypothetical protein